MRTARTLAIAAGALTAWAGTLAAAALQPPSGKEPAPAPTGAKDLVDTVIGNKDLSTLAGALRQAGVVDALRKTDRSFTLFAPTNDAFTKLPKEVLDNLMKAESKEQLKNVLLFHVIPAEVTSEKLLRMPESSRTLQGTTFRVRIKDGKRQVGNERAWAAITTTDVRCSNGLVHIIDAVMLPIEPKKKDEPKPEPKPEPKTDPKPDPKAPTTNPPAPATPAPVPAPVPAPAETPKKPS